MRSRNFPAKYQRKVLAKMTAQMAEVLWIDGKKHYMFSNPLEEYFIASGERPAFRRASTACWRGYVGEWELNGGMLYLRQLEGTLIDGQTVTVASLFPEDTNPILAHWFTGEVQVPLGKMKKYVHMGYGSVYEDELTLEFDCGMLTREIRRNSSLFRRLKFMLKFHWNRIFSAY